MRIEKEVVQELVKKASRRQLAATVPADFGRINVEGEAQALRERLAGSIDVHLQPWFVLLDESIQFFVQFERYLYEFPRSAAISRDLL